MKWLQWMSKVFMITLLSTIISITTTWVIVDLYAEQILKKFNLTDLRNHVQLFDVIGHLTEQAAPERSIDTEAASEASDRESAVSSTDDEDEGMVADDEDTQSKEDSDERDDPLTDEDAVAVWGGQAASYHEIVMSADEFNKARDELSGEDKLRIFSIISEHLTEELMLQLSVMLEGGLTRGEIEEIEDMIQKTLNEEEIEQLMSIISPFMTH